MIKHVLGACLALSVQFAFAEQEETKPPTPEEIKNGSALYARHCQACHGPRMADPEGAFDLRKFPPDEPQRFVRSVTNGKNMMPPWGGLLKPEEIKFLWAYVTEGEKK